MIPESARGQLEDIVSGLAQILEDALLAVYLHGSAVLDCFGPRSDIDLLAVVQAPVPLEAKRSLVTLVLAESGPYEGTGGRWPVELDVVPVAALRRWRHPAPFEFHYGEYLRPRFEAGELEPWESPENRDLAAHVRVARHSGVALVGPPPEDLLPEVPEADFRDALLYDLEWGREHLRELGGIPGGIRNLVLGLARVWSTLATGEPQSKVSGAAWALPRLRAELRPVLEHARDLYVGALEDERWGTLPVADYNEAVADAVDHQL